MGMDRCEHCGQAIPPKYKQKAEYELRLSAKRQSATKIWSSNSLNVLLEELPRFLRENQVYFDSGGAVITIEQEPREELDGEK